MKATWGAWYWPTFLALTSGAFLVAEILALATNAANTLSDFAWRELGLPLTGRPPLHTASWLLSLGAWLTVAFWLTEHIWFRKFR